MSGFPIFSFFLFIFFDEQPYIIIDEIHQFVRFQSGEFNSTFSLH